MAQSNVIESLQDKAKRHVSKLDAAVFLGAFILTMLVHFYLFTHKFINHDDIDGLYSSCSFGLSSGRWLLQTVCGLTGNFSSSWLNGTAGAIYLAVAMVAVVRIYELQHLLTALLVTLCMVAFPTVASTYAYMFCSSPYLFALMLAAVGAWCISREHVGSVAAGSVLIALSMGCYQAYFGLAAALLVVSLILGICKDRWGSDWKPFFATGVKYVLGLLAGMVLYLVILKLCLWITGTELTEYQGIRDMGKLTPWTFLVRIAVAYWSFFRFYTNAWLEIFHGGFLLVAVLCMLFTLACVAWAVCRKKMYRTPWKLGFLVLLVLLFPLASNFVYVMTSSGYVHLVMVYPMVVVLTLPAVAADGITIERTVMRRGLQRLLTAAALLGVLLTTACGYEGVLITNRAYFSMDVTYENVYAYFVKLTAKLELTEGYTKDSPIAMIGDASMDNYVPPTNMTGVLTGDAALNFYSRGYFLSYFLASDYHYVSPEEREAIQNTPEFQAMPCYPAEGSIQNINGTITVKFSE